MRNAIVLFFALAAAAAGAQTPPPFVMAHQGRLFDGEDKPITGSHRLTFRPYLLSVKPLGVNETPVWEEEYTVQFFNGFYSVTLGTTEDGKAPLAPSHFPAAEERWLAVRVDDDAELTPRLRIGSVPHALRPHARGRVGDDGEARL